MTFLTSLVLVVAAAILAIAGIAGGASGLFFLSAACSGLAVVLIWRRSVAEREKFTFPDQPDRTDPDWTRELSDRDVPERAPDETAGLRDEHELGIAKFDELLAAEVLPRLETLSLEQLRAVVSHEKAGLGREAIIRRAERLIELTIGGSAGIDIRPEPVIHGRPQRDGLEPEQQIRRPGPDLSL